MDIVKRITRITYRRMLVIILLIGLIIPTAFTAVQMGCFSEEPMLDVQLTATSPDAPVLRVATDYDFCPNSYINQKGELSGLYIEIATEMANRMGVNLEFKTGEWLECREMLTNGEADILLGLEIFSNMEGTLRTIPICSDELCVYGKDTIDSAAALAGKRVSLMARSVIEATYDLQCEYVEYYTNTDILRAAEIGETDYAIFHSAVASKIIEKNGFHLKKSLPVAKSYPAMAVDDSRPELKEEINSVLQAMSIDGTIGRLQDKWITEFTKDRSFLYVLKSNKLFYITFFFAVIIVLCICIAFRLLEKKQGEYIRSLLDYQKLLKKSNEEAVRANQTKSVFLSHMSHDIRTPMNGILGMAAQIRRNENNPQVIDSCLNKIDAASNHLLMLLNDVLDMSALEQGKVNLEEKPFDLNRELESVRLIVEEQIREKNLTFEIHTSEIHHSCLIGSPLHLRRILLNLISNAAKYNKPGGRIDLSVEEFADHENTSIYQFVIQDTGIGMSREFLEQHLYKPFTQENDNVRTVYQGTGLGMSIVSELVKVMNGTIDVQSEQGKGTVFTVRLPFPFDNAGSAENESSVKEADISGMKILVVEDNALNREIAQCMLEESGALVVTAENGEEALTLFSASEIGEFDAILMDIMMPVMDGMQAARAIRNLAREDAGTIPIIAMTANAFIEDKKKALEAGMNEHLTKPIDSSKLHQILSQYRKS